jgi:hypothetical protein
MPQMDHYLDVINPGALGGPNKSKKAVMHGNWEASMADAMMAFGVLADDRARYEKGLALFRHTVDGYFKWGRGRFAAGRMIGEATETLRDIYHTLFGLGSLIQVGGRGEPGPEGGAAIKVSKRGGAALGCRYSAACRPAELH